MFKTMSFFWVKMIWYSLALQCLTSCVLASSPAPNSTSSHALFANDSSQTHQPPSTSPLASLDNAKTGHLETHSLTAHAMRDFVAMGMGMSASNDILSTNIADITTSSETFTFPISATSHNSNHSGNSSTVATTHQDTSSTGVSTTTSSDRPVLHETGTAHSNTTSGGYIPIGTQPPVWENQSRNLNYSGDCWNQWNQYWSAEDLPAEESTYWSSQPGTTLTSFYIEGNYLSTSTVLSSYETTVFNGRFPITTYSTLAPVTVYDVISGTPTTTWFFTETTESIVFYVATRPTLSLQSPSCILPSIVSQCQQSWDSFIGQRERRDIQAREDGPPGCDPAATTEIPWTCQAAISSWDSASRARIAEGNAPKCTQARVAESHCSSARSQFLHNGERRGYYFPDEPSTPATVDGTLTSIMVWPSNATVGGPGCTLGCGNCALQGETVELLFWPPATSLANATATVGHVGPWTLETLGTTLTSPTVCPQDEISGIVSTWC